MATRHPEPRQSVSPVSPAVTDSPPASDSSNEISFDALHPVVPEQGPSDPLPPASSGVAADSREQRIARAAHRRAEQRGFAPGGELDDWLAAEREIDAEADQP